jgi:MoaA/NifB/PqqE/SkfB family radical SAM enzyme
MSVTRKPKLKYLIFYVTSRCNLRCAHCFYLDELNQHAEMSIEEIEKVARSVSPLTFLRMTGGEPMLRKDLPEIIRAFHHHAQTRRMGVITNGMRPEWVEKSILRTFELTPTLTLDVGVSLDGLRDIHDNIRGVIGSYDRARQTVQILQHLKETLPGLQTSIDVTVTSKNEPQLELLYEEISQWGVDRISVNHVRGKVHDPSLLEVPYERYRWFAERCEQYHLTRQPSWKSNIQRAKNRLTRSAIEQVVNGEPSSIDCLAGSSIGVLYSDGQVNVCEMLEGELTAPGITTTSQPLLGNIRDVDHDFYRIWHSERAQQCREWISATQCSCSHECFLTASILFGRKNYPRLGWEWLKLSTLPRS